MTPAYVAVYQQKYGSLEGVLRNLSFSDLKLIAADTTGALTSDVPSFVRLNQSFGDNASSAWLYAHLKNLLTRFLVDQEKIADSQIEFLADIISNNHPTMKLTEFMLFETYFLGGRYEEFYGETSYILAITRSLQRFKQDLNTIYWQIEREKEKTVRKETTPGISWEQYCKDRGMEGKPYPGTIKEAPVKVRTVIKKPTKLTEVQVGVNSAHAVIDNIYRFDKSGVAQLRDAFRKRYGCWPEDYLKEHEEVVEE